jgi:hypothetical protein
MKPMPNGRQNVAPEPQDGRCEAGEGIDTGTRPEGILEPRLFAVPDGG